MLRLLEVPEGSRVLEVGTGSGYSTALLSVLVGPFGRVISVVSTPTWWGVPPGSLEDEGRASVQVLLADGRLGYAPVAPYDRLIAWASAQEPIPDAWAEQVLPGGLIVAPIRTDVGQFVARLRLTSLGEAAIEQTIEGGFIPLTGEPFRPWEQTPPRAVT